MDTHSMQTIEDLEGTVWADDHDLVSDLARRCRALRRKPIGRFTIEDLRLIIGQNIGTDFLMSKAIAVLRTNPFASGDYYEGDLLAAVVHLPMTYWKQRLDYARAILPIVNLVLHARMKLQDTVKGELERFRDMMNAENTGCG